MTFLLLHSYLYASFYISYMYSPFFFSVCTFQVPRRPPRRQGSHDGLGRQKRRRNVRRHWPLPRSPQDHEDLPQGRPQGALTFFFKCWILTCIPRWWIGELSKKFQLSAGVHFCSREASISFLFSIFFLLILLILRWARKRRKQLLKLPKSGPLLPTVAWEWRLFSFSSWHSQRTCTWRTKRRNEQGGGLIVPSCSLLICVQWIVLFLCFLLLSSSREIAAAIYIYPL